MRKLVFISCLFAIPLGITAQLLPGYSQYIYNGLILNPAYAGSGGQLSFMAIGREQWTGIPGSPSTQSVFLHAPSGNLRSGFGLAVVNDKMAVSSVTDVSVSYAYRIPFDDQTSLSFGLKGTICHAITSLSSVRTGEGNDNAFTGQDQNVWIPDAGAGIYMDGPDYFLGISVPQLLELSAIGNPANSVEFSYRRHFLFTGGMTFSLGNDVELQPFALLKYAVNFPVSANLNANLKIKDRLILGTGYRTDDAWITNIQWIVSKNFRFGYSYDFPLGIFGPFRSGSHELMLAADMIFTKRSRISPRGLGR